MRALIVAHYFPPDGGAGSQRPASFARHLPGLGVETTVVAREAGNGPRGRYEPADPTLCDRTGAAEILRARREGSDDWTSALGRLAIEAARARRPDVALITLSPFELAAIGPSLRSETGTPYVLDLRDPWALDGWHTYRHALAWRRARDTMRRALEDADGVVLNVPGAVAPVAALAPRAGRIPYAVVTNGWEPDEFPPPTEIASTDRLRIRFAGTFVCRFVRDRSPLRRLRAALLGRGERIDERGRSPMFLLRALERLHREGFAGAGDFLVEIAGAPDPEAERLVRESGRADQVRHVGYLRHADNVRFIREADVLLLPMHGLRRGERARMVPGKLYEYLATGRPILGLCPEGDARDWIARVPGSRLADPVDEAGIAEALRALHADWRAGRLAPGRRGAWVEDSTRAAQAMRLRDHLARVVADSAR
ncbi:MAG: hypothetical protein RIS86_1962 [Planctomycetota bacterium]